MRTVWLILVVLYIHNFVLETTGVNSCVKALVNIITAMSINDRAYYHENIGTALDKLSDTVNINTLILPATILEIVNKVSSAL